MLASGAAQPGNRCAMQAIMLHKMRPFAASPTTQIQRERLDVAALFLVLLLVRLCSSFLSISVTPPARVSALFFVTF
jgi:hypothetical protein